MAQRPCQVPGGCKDQCPDLDVDDSNSRRCLACNCLAIHHRIPASTPVPPSSTPPTPPLLSNPAEAPAVPTVLSRWRTTLDQARQSLSTASGSNSSTTPVAPSRYPTTLGIATALAQKEVQSGFRSSSSSSKSRSVSLAKPLPLRVTSAKGFKKAQPSRKALQVDPEPSFFVQVACVIVVPWAIDHLTEDSNNSGQPCYSIQGCSSPRPSLEDHLTSYGYCRSHQPQDKLELDRRLDADQTAAWVAAIFPSCWKQYCQAFHLPTSSTPPANWVIHLKKRRLQVSTFAGQVGVTMEQLIEEGSMTGGRLLTKKIYIAFPVRLHYADPNPKSLAKGKRRAKSIDSLDENESGVDASDNETYSGNAKRQKFGSPDSEPETEAAHHETTSLPPLVNATPSVSASLSATALDALASQFPQPSPPSPTPTDIEVDHQVEHASASFSALLRISDPPSKDDITKDWLESKDTDNLSGPEEFLNSQRRYGGASCGSGSNPFQEGYSLDI